MPSPLTLKRCTLLLALFTSFSTSAVGFKAVSTFCSIARNNDVSTSINRKCSPPLRLGQTSGLPVTTKLYVALEPDGPELKNLKEGESTWSTVTPDYVYTNDYDDESSEIMLLEDLTFEEYVGSMWTKFAGGDGQGDLYFGTQTALVLLIALGEVPLIGDPLKLVMGSSALFGGVGALIAGVVELSSKHDETSNIVETGIYSLVRHPIYAGLIAICSGYSFMTDSTMRLFYSILLYYCLEKKANFEEALIIEQDPSYIIYKEEVRGKFIPHELIEALPWEEKPLRSASPSGKEMF